MKTYWPLALMVCILGTILGMSQYADSAKKNYEESHKKAKTASVAKDDNGKPTDDTQETYKPPVWGKYVTFPEGLGAWAVVLTLLAIVWQSIETRKSANAAANSANAAYGALTFAEAQFEMMKEKDRAKLDVSVERNALRVEVQDDYFLHLISTLLIRNVGESKAFISVVRGVLVNKVGSEALGDIGHATLDLPDGVLEPNKTPLAIEAFCFPEATAPTFAECLEKGTYSLHFFGFIEYETLGLWWRKEFGYDWQAIERNAMLGGLYGLSDPYPNSPMPTKGRIAYGYWRPNEERNRPEYPISKPQEDDDPN